MEKQIEEADYYYNINQIIKIEENSINSDQNKDDLKSKEDLIKEIKEIRENYKHISSKMHNYKDQLHSMEIEHVKLMSKNNEKDVEITSLKEKFSLLRENNKDLKKTLADVQKELSELKNSTKVKTEKEETNKNLGNIINNILSQREANNIICLNVNEGKMEQKEEQFINKKKRRINSEKCTDKEKTKKKKKGNSDGIKKIRSSFNYFFQEKYMEIKNLNLGLKTPDISKKIAEEWKILPEEKKQHYKNLTSNDKERYLMEKKGLLINQNLNLSNPLPNTNINNNINNNSNI